MNRNRKLILEGFSLLRDIGRAIAANCSSIPTAIPSTPNISAATVSDVVMLNDDDDNGRLQPLRVSGKAATQLNANWSCPSSGPPVISIAGRDARHVFFPASLSPRPRLLR